MIKQILNKLKQPLTNDKKIKIISLIQFLIIGILFTSGYLVLFSVNGILANYLLSANLLFFANLYLYKMK